MDQYVGSFGEGAAEISEKDRPNCPVRTFSVHYPSPGDVDWKAVESQDRNTLLLSDTARMACKHRRDLSKISVRRDASSPCTSIVQWPSIDEYVRLYLDISSLAGPPASRRTLVCEVTLSLVSARPIECDWIALVRQDSRGWFPVHRRIEPKVRFARGDSRKKWTIRLTSEEIQQGGRLFVAIQLPGAATEFRLEQFVARLQSIETDVAALTACIGGLVEGWTRIDDARLWFGTEADKPLEAGIPVGFGYFTRLLPAPPAGEATTCACLISDGEVVAYLDLPSWSASLRAASGDDAPSEGGLSLRTVEWLYEHRKIELLWKLGDRIDVAELPETVQHAITLYRSLLGAKAVESAYRGLRETTGTHGAFQMMPANVQRRMRLRFARLCQRSGRPEEAETVLRQMQAADPLAWECYFQLATLVAGAGSSLRRTYLEIAESLNPRVPGRALTVIIEDLLAQGRVDEAWVRALRELKARGTQEIDLWLTLGNVHLARGDRLNWSASVRRMFAESGLAEPELEVSRGPMEDIFHRLGASANLAAPGDQSDLITVIMTTYNAERTVKGAVQSVLAQSYSNLRLVVVDDCSSDDTLLLLRQMRSQDGRIEILQTPFNVGTYCAKNMALSQFESDFFTFHDSDDWMHPERLAVHHAAMQADPRLMCTMSRWYRMDVRGAAAVRPIGGYLHTNPASTFFHSSVVERMGYFDSVRTGADAELNERIQRCFGPVAMQIISKPLAIGLYHSASMTRSGVSAYDEHHYSAPRVAYWEVALDWHRRSVAKRDEAQDLYMPFPHHPRLFAAPAEIVPDRMDELERALKPARDARPAARLATPHDLTGALEASPAAKRMESSMNAPEDVAAKRQEKARNAAFLAEVETWFQGKDFTTDWMTRKAPRWHQFLHSLRDKSADVLEVGSFEGRSAVFLLNYLPLAHLTCVDFFRGDLDARFDSNLAPFGSRLTKLKGSAIAHVDALGQSRKKFDLIYLDAGKQRDPVLALSLLAWPLLKQGGFMIWDDYEWGLDRPTDQRPHDGIDVFLKLHEADYELLWNRVQVFVQRTSLPTSPAGHSIHSPNLSY